MAFSAVYTKNKLRNSLWLIAAGVIVTGKLEVHWMNRSAREIAAVKTINYTATAAYICRAKRPGRKLSYCWPDGSGTSLMSDWLSMWPT